jgi:sporulation protein YlmC with PRC-barrel domain
MKQLQTLTMLLTLSVAGAALAQTETAPPATPEEDTTQQSSPAPSTSPAEGTAADRTPPGETQTRPQGTTDPATDPTTEPRPATDVLEGTAADQTPPGETRPGETATTDPTRTTAAGDAGGSRRASKLIGMKVQTPTGESIGEVEDIVLDEMGSVSQVLVNRSSPSASTESRPASSRLAALPWSEVKSMIKADALVIERAKLDGAKSYQEGSMR